MASQESRVEVEIFGENYIVKGDQSPERIMMLAQYVNRKMRSWRRAEPQAEQDPHGCAGSLEYRRRVDETPG